ncbi:MAG: ChbG/HpnK family deacetylase [Chloroflexi bacterium]|nr:ChbG/HpnK family deacetylase [Chloroflexota bacterium]
MIRLIVNADDYGRTAEVSRGVRQAHLQGIVTSTTCMMNMPTTTADIRIAMEETPDIGMGVHLVLTAGKPLSPPEAVDTLTDPQGWFPKYDRLLTRLEETDIAQVKIEWRAQIEAFIAASGRRPTHLDSHHHSSFFSEPLMRAMLELACEYNCAIRLPRAFRSDGGLDSLPEQVQGPIQDYAPRLLAEFEPRRPDAFFGSFYDDLATREELLRILDQLGEGISEMMCHPGYADPSLIASSYYSRQRESELHLLTNPSIKEMIAQKGIELISFAEIG